MPTTLIDTQGTPRDVPDAEVPALLERGWRAQTHADVQQAASQAASQVDYGGTKGAIGAIGAGALRGATLGGSDVVARAIGGDEAAETLRGLRAENPGLSAGGEIAGVIAPALLSGGAALPAGLAGRAGAAIRAGSEGLGLAGAIGRGALSGAVEGGLFGAGQGVSELALDDSPLTFERAASTLSSNMLFGAATGGAIGGAGAALERGMLRAKGAIDEAMARKTVQDTSPDLAALDAKGLRGERETELEAIRTAQAPERDAFVNDLRASREAAKEEKTWIATQGGKTREVREIGLATLEADKRVDSLLKVEQDLMDKPQRALSALRQQEQALTRMQSWGERATQGYLDEVAGARDAIRAELLENKVPGYVFGKGGISRTSPVVDDITDKLFQERYPHPDRLPTNLQVLTNVPKALERNKALQDKLAALTAPPTSERLGKIDAAHDALGVPKEQSLGQHILGAAAHVVGGPAAAIATTGAKMLGGLKEAVGKVTERAGAAASAMLGTGAKIAARAPLATKVLASVRYAPADERKAPEPQGRSLQALFAARTDEIKSLTAYDETGTPRLRPEARQAMASRLRGIAAVDPILADRIETLARVGSSTCRASSRAAPRSAVLPIGPRWQPSDMEMRSWARSVAAVEDPHGVLERAAAGGVVTPEDIGALQNVHPEILAAWTNEVSDAGWRCASRTLARAQDRAVAAHRPADRPGDGPRDPLDVPGPVPVRAGPGPRAEPQFGSVKNRAEVGTPRSDARKVPHDRARARRPHRRRRHDRDRRRAALGAPPVGHRAPRGDRWRRGDRRAGQRRSPPDDRRPGRPGALDGRARRQDRGARARLDTLVEWRERTRVEFDDDVPRQRTNPHGYRPPARGGRDD
jgi:hypothetical protein